ncbi:CYP4A5 protein [Aphelenchoides avenae]|nr:CYP4A5 protein [Aphelenchus avenae]KAH7723077.1 CYP4A5 protein [Aphelenchus avenae]
MQKVSESDVKKEPQNFLDIVWADKDKDTVLYEELCEDLDAAVAGATHPALQEKVYEEICSVLGEGEVDLTLDTINELRYLDMCVKEAMRIFPTVPFMDRRLQHDMELGGKLVPKGSSVLISPLIIHHNYTTYPQHDDFGPDNFLPERASQRNAYDYVPFSAGPRNCIGQLGL